MGRNRRGRSWVVLATATVLLLGGVAWAQSSDWYDLTWHTIDGGGAVSLTGGGYSLGGTAGQSDAGLLSGGPYVLGGGFWGGGAVAGLAYEFYVPLVLRGFR